MARTLTHDTSLYETDYLAWIEEQAGHLRAGRWRALDARNLAMSSWMPLRSAGGCAMPAGKRPRYANAFGIQEQAVAAQVRTRLESIPRQISGDELALALERLGGPQIPKVFSPFDTGNLPLRSACCLLLDDILMPAGDSDEL